MGLGYAAPSTLPASRRMILFALKKLKPPVEATGGFGVGGWYGLLGVPCIHLYGSIVNLALRNLEFRVMVGARVHDPTPR